MSEQESIDWKRHDSNLAKQVLAAAGVKPGEYVSYDDAVILMAGTMASTREMTVSGYNDELKSRGSQLLAKG